VGIVNRHNSLFTIHIRRKKKFILPLLLEMKNDS